MMSKIEIIEGRFKVVITLTQCLYKVIRGADLVMLITDHPQYEKLKPSDLEGYIL